MGLLQSVLEFVHHPRIGLDSGCSGNLPTPVDVPINPNTEGVEMHVFNSLQTRVPYLTSVKRRSVNVKETVKFRHDLENPPRSCRTLRGREKTGGREGTRRRDSPSPTSNSSLLRTSPDTTEFRRNR